MISREVCARPSGDDETVIEDDDDDDDDTINLDTCDVTNMCS